MNARAAFEVVNTHASHYICPSSNSLVVVSVKVSCDFWVAANNNDDGVGWLVVAASKWYVASWRHEDDGSARIIVRALIR